MLNSSPWMLLYVRERRATGHQGARPQAVVDHLLPNTGTYQLPKDRDYPPRRRSRVTLGTEEQAARGHECVRSSWPLSSFMTSVRLARRSAYWSKSATSEDAIFPEHMMSCEGPTNTYATCSRGAWARPVEVHGHPRMYTRPLTRDMWNLQNFWPCSQGPEEDQ